MTRDDLVTPVAVICAMECELVHLRDMLPQGREEAHGGRRFTPTRLDGAPIVLVCCGIGMTSAAAVTEATIARYRPAAVLNYGCAGAHRLDLLPGDVVIGTRVVAHDSIRHEPDGRERYAGMYYLRDGVQEKIAYLPAAPHLLDAAIRAASALEGQHEPWPPAAGWPSAIPHRAPRVVMGTVASADRWNRGEARIQGLAALHDSLCEDMEAAAIALTCASHDVPFLTIKDISNNELLRLTGDDFLVETDGQLGRRAAALIHATTAMLVHRL